MMQIDGFLDTTEFRIRLAISSGELAWSGSDAMRFAALRIKRTPLCGAKPAERGVRVLCARLLLRLCSVRAISDSRCADGCAHLGHFPFAKCDWAGC